MLPADAAEPYDVAGDPRLAEALVTPLEEAKIRGLARTLRTAIFSGGYRADDKLPTRTEMAKANKVSAETIGNVMRMLAGEGLVRLEQGRGSFVQPVRRYDVTVLVPLGAPVEEETRARSASRLQAQQDDDPAIGATSASPDNGSLRIRAAVTAADSGRAASMGMTLARFACPAEDGWDLAGASVTATPA